ncbi:MAG: DNA-binding protein [Geobacteraceae bacterium GWC2_58_44]|nr:MAG: DNA-binding protein [Geobacteraceae bacterium GWC2_58_44]HBG04330.1 DNA-binding protein [Geobacter sp.]
MNAKGLVPIVAALLMASLVSTASAAPWQGWRGSGGWGMGSAYQRIYDPAKVESVTGEVVSVEKITPMRQMKNGIHLQLRTEKETIPVHLGPSWYIERLDTRIEKGDKIEVKGSRVMVAGKPALIAAEVKKGDALLKLRDENGIPAWAGWRK